MYAVRLWSVRRAGFWEKFWLGFERLLLRASPWLQRIGYTRLEVPAAALERSVKGFLFDCRMCGACVLSQTGMSCPMNCPKQMRNGPCGGVRPNGFCEVEPGMRCVWVQAWEGSRRMSQGGLILVDQPPVDRSCHGSSSWIRLLREKAPEPAAVAAGP